MTALRRDSIGKSLSSYALLESFDSLTPIYALELTISNHLYHMIKGQFGLYLFDKMKQWLKSHPTSFKRNYVIISVNIVFNHI